MKIRDVKYGNRFKCNEFKSDGATILEMLEWCENELAEPREAPPYILYVVEQLRDVCLELSTYGEEESFKK